jgi:photosystem II stability/assembly factor-like uncharacterized protein
MRAAFVIAGICVLVNSPKAGAPSQLATGSQASLAVQDRPIRAAHLVSRSHGCALVDDHLLWTENEGMSWTDITPPLNSEKSIDAVFFRDLKHAWVMLHRTAYPPAIYIGKSEDSGRSWSIEAFADDDPEMINSYGNLAAFSFADETHGWVLLTKQSSSAASLAGMFATGDGGNTWSRLPDPPINGSIRFTSEQVGWITGGVLGNELYVSKDGGRSWIRREVKPPAQAESAWATHYALPTFHDAKHGILPVTYSVGPDLSSVLAVYATADGGDTWELKNAEGPSPQRSGSFTDVDSTVIDAFYAGGSIIIGKNFHRRGARLPAELPAEPGLQVEQMNFVDLQNGWLLASRNRGCMRPGCTEVTALLGTVDGGKTVSLLLGSTETRGRSASDGPLSQDLVPSVRNLFGADSFFSTLCRCCPTGSI